jgi:hypothetical protein
MKGSTGKTGIPTPGIDVIIAILPITEEVVLHPDPGGGGGREGTGNRHPDIDVRITAQVKVAGDGLAFNCTIIQCAVRLIGWNTTGPRGPVEQEPKGIYGGVVDDEAGGIHEKAIATILQPRRLIDHPVTDQGNEIDFRQGRIIADLFGTGQDYDGQKKHGTLAVTDKMT